VEAVIRVENLSLPRSEQLQSNHVHLSWEITEPNMASKAVKLAIQNRRAVSYDSLITRQCGCQAQDGVGLGWDWIGGVSRGLRDKSGTAGVQQGVWM
jgi:hypothetical protein